MASGIEFVAYVCEQIGGCGVVSSKKMFGEYLVYLNGKPIYLICNDTVYVKVLDVTVAILGENAEQGIPYNGSKPYYIIDNLDDREFMCSLALAVEKVTLLPKPKKKKPALI